MNESWDVPAIEVIDDGVAKHPGAAVLILPRVDGQYSGYASDILGLLDEVSVTADYLTDPMLTGVHEEKAADAVLPLLFFASTAVATAADWITLAEGIIHVVRYFVHRVGPKGTVRFRGVYEVVKHGHRETATVSLDLSAGSDPTAAIREALRPLRHD